MANSFAQNHNLDDFPTRFSEAVIDTFADPILDVDIGGTTLLTVAFQVSAGSDFWLAWDKLDATRYGRPDFQIPTVGGMVVEFDGGAKFLSNGLSFTVANVGGTVSSGNPSNANTVGLVTTPA